MTAIAVAAVLLAACGTDTTTASSEPSGASTAAAQTTTNATIAGSAVPGTTAVQVTTPETAVDGPVQIDVVVGVDSSPDRVIMVTIGADVTLNITNPDADDEFHVHGIDLEQAALAGQMVTINFTITAAGSYEVESHITQDVLVVIEAS